MCRNILGFNSKMVRLQVQGKKMCCTFATVSIPKWCDYKRKGIQYGGSNQPVSIPKWCDYKTAHQMPSIANMRFNSKMVRLQALHACKHSSGVLGFNSKMVRLQAALPTCCCTPPTSFNSKMVRLQAGGLVSVNTTPTPFQFQNGAITRFRA